MEDITLFRINKNTLNFGDACIDLFINKLTDIKFNFVNINNTEIANETPHYLTVGSIMTQCTDKSIIWGSGFIAQDSSMGTFSTFKKKNTSVCQPLKIVAVRGLLTHQKLIDMKIKLSDNICYGDPIILFPLIMQPTLILKRYDIGIIPHYIDQNNSNLYQLTIKLTKKYKVNLINILTGSNEDKVQNFVNEISACDTIISSSLHGIIMGIIYDKKTIFVNFSDKLTGHNFKFLDFFSSINVNYEIPKIDDDDLLNKYINYDKENITKLSIDLIESCPFLDLQQKSKYKKILQK
jgi:pyruvyltransferase